MSYGPIQYFYTGIASGASTSSYVDFGGKSFSRYAINVVTMSTGAAVTIYGAASAAGTYYPIAERVNTAPVQHQALTIATTTSGQWVMFDNLPFQYVKFITSAVVSGGVSFSIQAAD